MTQEPILFSTIFAIYFGVCFCGKYQAGLNYVPRHVHLSYGNLPSEMVITWSTLVDGLAVVEYGTSGQLQFWAFGTTTKFTDPGPLNLSQFIHRVKLSDLEPGIKYEYHCGNNHSWSEIFSFRSMPTNEGWLPRVAIYGDLGTTNARSLPRLQKEVGMSAVDAVFHLGDFAYFLHENNGLVGDAFMDQIQPVASLVPYMTCPGNHDKQKNFTHYKNRFTMPGESEGMYYSFNMGPIHYISFNTECYHFLNFGTGQLISQYNWLKKDLKEATKPKNRRVRPWIIAGGHRPMYCSNNNHDDCTRRQARVRVGVNISESLSYGLEDLFMKFGVDLIIAAHEHSYERFFPLYNYIVLNGTPDEPYKNPGGLVHVTTGSAGCFTLHDKFHKDLPTYTAFRHSDYGYSRLQIINSTHLYMEQVSDDKGGKVVDSFTLIREHHLPYNIPKDRTN